MFARFWLCTGLRYCNIQDLGKTNGDDNQQAQRGAKQAEYATKHARAP